MLGVTIDEAAAQRSDAIGEICNMVAGQFKAKIGLEAECMLLVPTIITGTSYQLPPRADYDRLEMPLIYQAEALSGSQSRSGSSSLFILNSSSSFPSEMPVQCYNCRVFEPALHHDWSGHSAVWKDGPERGALAGLLEALLRR